MKTRRIILVISSLVIFGAILTAAYFIGKSKTTNPVPTSPTSSDTSPSPSPTSPNTSSGNITQPQPNYPVKVYFSKHPESDDDPARTFPVSRTASTIGVGQYVIGQIIQGPTQSEQASGYFSTVHLRNVPSNCGGKDFTLAVSNNVATLRFCKTFDALATVSDGQAKQTLTDSLLQFSSVKKVIILTPDGHCHFDMSGEDRCLQ